MEILLAADRCGLVREQLLLLINSIGLPVSAQYYRLHTRFSTCVDQVPEVEGISEYS